MSGSVTVLWRGRRQVITTNPNTKLTQILEQACAKCGLLASGHTLRYQNKPVNLSLSLRMANIPNNAKFDITPTDDVRQAKDVTLVVQFPDGQRLQHLCAASTPLWLVLTALDTRPELAGATVTRRRIERDGQGVYEQPVCVILNTQHGGDLGSLASTTLEAAGITEGSAILRLLFRPTDIAWEDAETRLAHLDQSAKAFVDNAASAAQRLAEERQQAQARTTQTTGRPQQPATRPESMGADRDTDMIDAPAQHPTPTPTPPATLPSNIFGGGEEGVGEVEPMDWERDRPPPPSHQQQRRPPATMGELLGVSLEPEPIRPEEAMPFKEFKFPEKKVEKPAGEGAGGRQAGPHIARQVAVFELDSAQTPSFDLPDEFYDVTVQDVRSMIQRMAENQQAPEKKPLSMTGRLHDGLAEKLSDYKTTVLRIQFPDRRVLQGTFEPKEPLSNLFEFVRTHVDPSVARGFVLYTTPPRSELRESKVTSLLQAGLVPAAVVHFKPPTDATRRCLRQDTIDAHGTTYQAAQSTATWKASQPPSNQSQSTSVDQNSRQQPPQAPGGGMGGIRGGGAQGGGVPKWMRLGK